jgi:hypothetical protein
MRRAGGVDGTIRRRALPHVLHAAVFVVPATLAVTVFVSWWGATQYNDTLWQVFLIGTGGILLALAMVWVLFVMASNYSILLSDEGVVVVTRRIAGGRISQPIVPWSGLYDPDVLSPRWGELSTDTQGWFINLSADQARAILTDPRCPLSGHVPAPVAKYLDITPGPPLTGSN